MGCIKWGWVPGGLKLAGMRRMCKRQSEKRQVNERENESQTGGCVCRKEY